MCIYRSLGVVVTRPAAPLRLARELRLRLELCLSMALLPIGLAASTANAQIEQIGLLANGVSANGSVVVGAIERSDGFLGMFRWTTTNGLLDLGVGVAQEVSRDGTTVVGDRFNGSVNRAVRWTAGTGVVELGQLPGAGAPGSAGSNGIDVSADGSVIVGLANTSSVGGPPFRGFRWTAASGMTTLGDLPGGFNFSQARSISGDGQTIVGVSNVSGAGGDRAVRWLGSNPTPIDMGLPPGLSGFTEARGVSGDGSVIVGVWGTDVENEAFRWTESGGYQLLGDLPGGLNDSYATATNFDGSVIIGVGNPGLDLPDEAFYWTPADGMRTFRDVLLANSIDASAWRTFDLLNDLSDDGRVVVGSGTLLDGSVAGFRVVIPAPSTGAMLVGAGLLASRRRRAR